MSTTTTFSTPLSSADVRWAVEQAARAPSIFNTQPWLFRWTDGEFELRADTRRGLTASDPEGRELVLSCGAALYNLRLALRKLGYTGTVRLLPDSGDPRLLARVAVVETKPADADERRAYAAMTRRHTHRGGFDDRALSPELAVLLQKNAEEESAHLFFVQDPGQRRRVLHLARAAERQLAADDEVQAEIAAWTPNPGTARRDGVPATSYAADPTSSPDDLAPRDWDQGRGIGALEPVDSPSGVVAVLATGRDLQVDWLQAGQALERVLVAAAGQWAFATIHSQVTEVPNLRAELRRELCISGYPQILLRFGYAPDAPLTPRRPVDEVLDLT